MANRFMLFSLLLIFLKKCETLRKVKGLMTLSLDSSTLNLLLQLSLNNTDFTESLES